MALKRPQAFADDISPVENLVRLIGTTRAAERLGLSVAGLSKMLSDRRVRMTVAVAARWALYELNGPDNKADRVIVIRIKPDDYTFTAETLNRLNIKFKEI